MAIKFGRPIEMRDAPRPPAAALSTSSLDLTIRPRRNRKQSTLIHLQLFDSHLIAARDLQLVRAAARTGIEALADRHHPLAWKAPGQRFGLDNLQLGVLGERSPGSNIEREAQRLGLDAG